MRHIRYKIWLALACAFTAFRLTAAVKQVDDTGPAMARLAISVNAFGFDLYGRLKAQPGNLAISPWRLESALVMAWAGAAGQTERQMAGVLGLIGAPTDIDAAFAAQAKRLLSYRERNVVVESANAVWVDQSADLLPLFSGRIRAGYGADVLKADFIQSNDTARININRWVARRTHDRIRDLVQPGMLSETTRVVLVNTLYFKGAWANRFQANMTKDQAFQIKTGMSISVPTMTQEGEFAYMDAADLQALELRYQGEFMAMLILLPRNASGLDDVERTLGPVRLQAVINGLRPAMVRVFLPRFKVESFFEMTKPLSAMGIKDAFDDKHADFSGMNGEKDLYVSAVLHKTVVEVNEDGAEATAASATMRAKAAPMSTPPDFRVDHPFFFMIRDLKTGAILFMGRVVNPG